MGRKGSRYSLEEKLFYIGLVRDGVSATSIHREYGVHHSQVAQWIMRYDDGWTRSTEWSSISTRVLRSAYA